MDCFGGACTCGHVSPAGAATPIHWLSMSGTPEAPQLIYATPYLHWRSATFDPAGKPSFFGTNSMFGDGTDALPTLGVAIDARSYPDGGTTLGVAEAKALPDGGGMLAYLECANPLNNDGGCGTLPWPYVTLGSFTPPGGIRAPQQAPQLVHGPGDLVAVALPDPAGGGFQYWECNGDCAGPNWAGGLVPVPTTSPLTSQRVGLAIDSAGQRLAAVADQDLTCSAGCASSAGWTSYHLPPGEPWTTDVELHFDPSDEPHSAALSGSSLIYGRCDPLGCGNGSLIVTLATDAVTDLPERLALGLAPGNLARLVYDADAGITELDELPGGSWDRQPLYVCPGDPYYPAGGVLQGTLPTLLLTDAGSPRIHLLTPNLLDAGVSHAWYSAGP